MSRRKKGKSRRQHHPEGGLAEAKPNSSCSSSDGFSGFSDMSTESSDDDNFHSIRDGERRNGRKEIVCSEEVCKNPSLYTELITCDGCLIAFHIECVNMSK